MSKQRMKQVGWIFAQVLLLCFIALFIGLGLSVIVSKVHAFDLSADFSTSIKAGIYVPQNKELKQGWDAQYSGGIFDFTVAYVW